MLEMEIEVIPEWIRNLEEEDVAFIKKFILASGSWLGLILPGICIVYSLLTVIGMISFTSATKQRRIIAEDGQVIKKVVDEEKDRELINRALVVFGISNMPTLVLMGIYLGCREKRKKNLQLEKMNIQDLE